MTIHLVGTSDTIRSDKRNRPVIQSATVTRDNALAARFARGPITHTAHPIFKIKTRRTHVPGHGSFVAEIASGQGGVLTQVECGTAVEDAISSVPDLADVDQRFDDGFFEEMNLRPLIEDG